MVHIKKNIVKKKKKEFITAVSTETGSRNHGQWNLCQNYLPAQSLGFFSRWLLHGLGRDP